jgi:hypothetical protein
MTNDLARSHHFIDEWFPVFTAGQWHLLTLTYDSDQSLIYLNDDPFPWSAGMRPDAFPNSVGRARNGFSIGSDRNGNYTAEGQFEDIKTFNYALDYLTIGTNYRDRAAMALANFSVRTPEYINTSSVLVEMDGAPSGSVAWAFNSIPTSPAWTSMQSFTVNLQEGENIVWIGLKDSSGATRWIRRSIGLGCSSQFLDARRRRILFLRFRRIFGWVLLTRNGFLLLGCFLATTALQPTLTGISSFFVPSGIKITLVAGLVSRSPPGCQRGCNKLRGARAVRFGPWRLGRLSPRHRHRMSAGLCPSAMGNSQQL